jgi:hypothetical protein
MVLLLLTTACRRELADHGDKSRIEDGKYDSEFPAKPVSDYLKRILKSVHLVSVLSFYKSYYFRANEAVSRDSLINKAFDFQARDYDVFEQPASGTATLIYNDHKRMAFLTCAHIVSFPDTVFTYHQNEKKQGQTYVKHYIEKVRQTGNIINQPVAYDFEILVKDEESDLAIIGKKLENENLKGNRQYQDQIDKLEEPIEVLDLPRGKADELAWGTFVYIIGFPRAKRMVSSALVSNPNYDQEHSFLLDGAMQKGISGGLVIALRDGVPNFELVGMVKGISGRVVYALVPNMQENVNEWEIHGPYNGPIGIKKQEIAEPGIIYATSIETILAFIDQNKEILFEKGYHPDLFFK